MRSPLRKIRNGAVALGTVFIAAVLAVRFLGNYSWLDSVWFVVITISTVGFNEQSDSSATIQLITIGLIILGVSAAAYTCGGFVQLALEGEIENVMGKRKMAAEISKLKDHVVICGFGRLGNDLAEQLTYRNETFVVIDNSNDRIAESQDDGFLCVFGDATDESVLNEANLAEAKAIVTALPTDAQNVFITLTARNLSPNIQIIAKAELKSSCKKLRQAGANKIVMPHKVGAQQMERMISRPTTADLVELFAEASNLDMELDEFPISEHSDLAGKSLADSGIKEDFNLLVVGLKNPDGEFQFNPGPSHKISIHDIVLVIGDVSDINRLKKAHA